jgi:diguanylate cyclase (GGDEF)-like protein
VVLVFGHALTCTRFVHVSAATLTIILAYSALQLHSGLDAGLATNLFFLIAAELALMAGSYLQELQHRQIHLQTRDLQRLSGELEEQAMLDPLTGLGNRRALEHRLAEHRAEARRYGVPTALLLADLDHFKRVNDQLGHPRGDEFLVGFARRIEGVLRDTDLAFRYGGDEFLILLPHTRADDGRTVAQRLILAARDLALEFGVDHLGVSCSVGMAYAEPAPEADPLAAVDAALYAAKLDRGSLRVATQTSASGFEAPLAA